MYKVTHITHAEHQVPDNTSYNDFPAGWREISQERFVHSFFAYSPDYIEFRQMMYPTDPGGNRTGEKTPMIEAWLYWYHDDTGIGIVKKKKNAYHFAFGCEHNYIELLPSTARKRGVMHLGRCYHVYECAKCQHILTTDSSD